DARLVLAARLELLLVDDPDVFAYPAILIQNRAFDVATAADAEWRLTGVLGVKIFVVEVIGPHNDRVFDRHTFPNDASQADDAVFNRATAANLAAIGDEAL